jgi:hypothetical protein
MTNRYLFLSVVAQVTLTCLTQKITDTVLVAQAVDCLNKEDRVIVCKFTGVPHPKNTPLKPVIHSRTLSRNVLLKCIMGHAKHNTDLWRKNTPVYRLTGMSLKALQSRKKIVPKSWTTWSHGRAMAHLDCLRTRMETYW